MRVSPLRTEIAKLRAVRGLLQKEAAELCGVCTGHYQAVELGTRKSEALTERARREMGR